MTESTPDGLTLRALQHMILQMYGRKDAARGDAATFLWLAEEFGELAAALRSGTPEELALEMADVLAWLVTLANVRGSTWRRRSSRSTAGRAPAAGRRLACAARR